MNFLELFFWIIHFKGLEIHSAGFIIFYSVAITAAVEFIRLAKNWREFMIYWYDHEKIFLKYPYESLERISLKQLIQIVAFTILIFAGIEHSLLLVNNIFFMFYKHDFCNITIPDFSKYYIESTKAWWFDIWSYHIVEVYVLEVRKLKIVD